MKRKKSDFDSKLLARLMLGLGENAEVKIAAEIGVHPTTVTRWCSGISEPNGPTKKELARIFGVEESQFKKTA